MKKFRMPANSKLNDPAVPERIPRFVTDPLNVISLAVFLVWVIVGIWFRPIGDFGVETDFYGDFVPFAREWMSGNPSIMLGYRGPFYYLLIGVVSTVGDAFLLAKILSAACTGIGVRIIGGLLRKLWNPTVAIAGSLFLVASPTLIQYSYRASTDLVYWALFAGTLALLFAENRRHYRTWTLAGVCAGLAYLTRYNGVVLVPMGIVAAFVLVRPWKRTAMTALSFCGAWLIIALPWLLFLWNQTGDPFWNRNFALVAEEVYGPSANLANIGHLVDSVGFFSLGEVFKLDPGRFLGVMSGNIFRHLWLDIKHLVGPTWAVFGLAGFAVSFRTWGNRRRLVFVLAGLIAYLGLLPVFYNQRFMLTMLIWWAAGIGNAAHYLIVRIGRPAADDSTTSLTMFRQRFLMNGLLVVLALAALYSTYLGIRRSQDPADGQTMPLAILKLAESVRESGLTFGAETPIVARKPHIGYYLGAPIGSISTPGRLNDMAGSGMHYLLVSDIESEIYPSLAPMLTYGQPAQKFPGYRYLAAARHWEKSGRKQTATLYAVENPAAWSPPDLVAAPSRVPSPAGLDRMDFLRLNLARWYLNWTVEQPLFPLFSKMNPASRAHHLVRETEGDAYLATKNYGKAESTYRDLLEGPGDHVDTLLRLALANHLAGDPRSFGQYMRKFTARWNMGEDPTMNDWISETATRFPARDYVPAAALLIQARFLEPDFPTGDDYRFLGYCYLNMRHPDRARAAFAKYLEFVPNDPEIMTVLKGDFRLTATLP